MTTMDGHILELEGELLELREQLELTNDSDVKALILLEIEESQQTIKDLWECRDNFNKAIRGTK